MTNLVLRAIRRSDAKQVRDLVDEVLASLERAEFFVPFDDWEYESFFDEEYGLIHGAYDGERLAGMSQLYCSDRLIGEARRILGLEESQCCEFGGILVLPEYRGQGIMYRLGFLQLEAARQRELYSVFALAHPDNRGSIKNLMKLAFASAGLHTLSNGHVREFYVRDLI